MLQLNEGVPLWQKALLNAGYIALWPLIKIVQRSHTRRHLKRDGYIRVDREPRALKLRKKGRSLTLTKTQSTDDGSPTLQTSLLLLLPHELRDLIWREVVTRKVIGWAVEHRALRRVTHGVNPDFYTTRMRSWPRTLDDEDRYLVRASGLIMSCRQIYSETINLLYSGNAFDVRERDVILYLPRLLLPQRINNITILHFEWRLRGPPSQLPGDYRTGNPKEEAKRNRKSNDYRDAWFGIWKNLSEMRGLRALTVELNVPSSRVSDWTVKELSIVKSITEPETFYLVLADGLGRLAREMEGEVRGSNCRIIDGSPVKFCNCF
ncbi:hypothetical protein VTL71DRAFT_15339 [Oculimacula yallundae]|uniref:DUF7730 domain-containing protein n=1 Tax=Oculimacula yallundae TaxID=86028 RepID=A0ABR4CID1_9HELO